MKGKEGRDWKPSFPIENTVPPNTNVQASSELCLTFQSHWTAGFTSTFSGLLRSCTRQVYYTWFYTQAAVINSVLSCKKKKKRVQKFRHLIQTLTSHCSWDQTLCLLESNKLLPFQTNRQSITAKLSILHCCANYYHHTALVFQHYTRAASKHSPVIRATGVLSYA